MISQTHGLVSQVRLPRWRESPCLLNEQCCHLYRGGSNLQLVCHTTLEVRGGLGHGFGGEAREEPARKACEVKPRAKSRDFAPALEMV